MFQKATDDECTDQAPGRLCGQHSARQLELAPSILARDKTRCGPCLRFHTGLQRLRLRVCHRHENTAPSVLLPLLKLLDEGSGWYRSQNLLHLQAPELETQFCFSPLPNMKSAHESQRHAAFDIAASVL